MNLPINLKIFNEPTLYNTKTQIPDKHFPL